MIKVNLLGDDTAIDHSKRFVLAGYIASLVICLAGSWFLYSSVNQQVEQLTQTSEDLQGQLDRLMKKTASVRDLEKKKKILSSKLALIAKLKKSKIGPVRVLDDLNIAVPSRVWLRRLTESQGNVEIKGRAMNNKDVVTFIRNLDSSDYFTNVNLNQSSLMFYSKRSGKVVPAQSLQALRSASPDFGAEGRVTKESAFHRRGMEGGKRTIKDDIQGSGGKKWAIKSNIKSGDIKDRNRFIDDQYIRINEFILTAKVNYYGKIVIAQAKTPKKRR